jgi:hypothetical protein
MYIEKNVKVKVKQLPQSFCVAVLGADEETQPFVAEQRNVVGDA